MISLLGIWCFCLSVRLGRTRRFAFKLSHQGRITAVMGQAIPPSRWRVRGRLSPRPDLRLYCSNLPPKSKIDRRWKKVQKFKLFICYAGTRPQKANCARKRFFLWKINKNHIVEIDSCNKMTFLTKNQFNFTQNDLESLTISDFLSSYDPKSVILKFFWFDLSFEIVAPMSNSSNESHNWSIWLSFLIGWRDLNHKVRRGLEMGWNKS